MKVVRYTHKYNYRSLDDEDRHPILVLTLKKIDVDILSFIDTGTEYSLFSADIAQILKIDSIRNDNHKDFVSTIGYSLPAYGHKVNFLIDNIPITEIIYFAEVDLPRNLLGRNFLTHLQIGFREYHQEFYLKFER